MVLYTAGCLSKKNKYTVTADALLRHCRHRVVGVADERADVKTLDAFDDWAWAGPIPVARDALELLDPDADLVIGLSLPGSERIFDRHRAAIVAVAEAGHRVFNGLHDLIDHPNVVNLRRFTQDERLSPTGTKSSSTRIVTVGTSADAGMLPTTVGLERALLTTGLSADWVPTSVAGVLIRGFGRCLDAVPMAFAAGVLHDLLSTVEAQAEVVVIEGQGSILKPGQAAMATTIGHVGRSQYYILCHRPWPNERDIASRLHDAATRYDALHVAGGYRSTLLAVSLDTSALSGNEARRALATGQALGVPCIDAYDDASPIVTALSALAKLDRP